MPKHSGHCEPYPFSTDTWSDDTVSVLTSKIAAQTPHPHRAGLVIGSGGLPYIAPRLNVHDLYVADRAPEVIRSVLGRTALVPEYSRWATYRRAVQAPLEPEDATMYGIEWRGAARLRDGYQITHTSIAQTALHGLAGDIRETAPLLGEKLVNEDALVSFVNFTNVAGYLGNPTYSNGRRELRELVLDVLPMALDAVIVDSGPMCVPTVYSLENYGS